jgi:hypothetical protein
LLDVRHCKEGGLLARQDGDIAPGEIVAFHASQVRPDHDIGILQLEAIDALSHDGKGLKQHIDRAGCHTRIRLR